MGHDIWLPADNNMQLSIFGTSISSGNRGVQALCSSLVGLFVKNNPGCQICLMVGHRDNHAVEIRVGKEHILIPVVNCRISPNSNLQDHFAWIFFCALMYRFIPIKGFRHFLQRHVPWIDTLIRSDLVGDIHGGDSFSDIYGLTRLIFEFIEDLTIILIKGSMVQFPQTYGPYRYPIAKWIARFLLKHSSVIIARDKKSQRVAQELVGASRNVWLSPDVAFSMGAILPEPLDLHPSIHGNSAQKVIGLNVNGLMYNGGYTRKNMFGLKMAYPSLLPILVERLLDEHDGEIWLVPHTFAPLGNVESDQDACRQVMEAIPKHLQGRIRRIEHPYDQHELKGIIGLCDFFIGSRMHACIAALSQGVPCVGIAYSMKFEGVFESVGMGGWVIDGRTTSNEEAISRLMDLYRQRDMVRKSLKVNSDMARDQLNNIFGRLLHTNFNLRVP